MNIFNIKRDSNNIQLLQATKPEFKTLEFINFDCEKRKKEWEELQVYIYNPKIKPKNFYSYASGILVFDEKALEICENVFEMSGEILPIQVERGPKLYLLNILECMNGLDYDSTIWDYYDDGTKGRILEYAFHKDRIENESTIFKIPETSKTDIFCFSDVKDRSDEFYHLYHDNNLTGLIFEEIK
jgi:hypothetical protein